MTRYLLLFILATLTACQSEKKEIETIREGKMTIAMDESLAAVIKEQIRAYQLRYPKAIIETRIEPEQRAIQLMLSDSVDAVAVTRELTTEEQAYFTQRKKRYEPAIMALEGVVLVTSKQNPIQSISIPELKQAFTNQGKYQLWFDQSNSSNLNFVKEKLKLGNLEDLPVYGAKGTLDMIERIQKTPNAIGFIGFNWISEDNPTSKKILEKIQIIGLAQDEQSEAILPSTNTLKARKYPFERLVYLHTTDNRWGVPMGFIRFSCAQVGQIITEKMGLIPYYVIPKEILLTKKPLNKEVKK